jgi:protein subunit release factor B
MQRDSTSSNDDATTTATPTAADNDYNAVRQGSCSSRDFSTSMEGPKTTAPWIVPDHIAIPDDKLIISYSRSSGAGGQNVNKVNTKVELRLHIPSASSWGLPPEVVSRLQTNEAHRISRDGYLILTSQEYRTQIQNRKDALNKLQTILRANYARPRVRKMRVGLSRVTKANRIEEKRKNSIKKESRGRVDFFEPAAIWAK